MICGWCLAFNSECCEGRFRWCEHGERCAVNTEKARQRAMARMRHGRQVDFMKGRIEKAWEQLDVAVDECARLGKLLQEMPEYDVTRKSFERDLKLEQAKARGKAEILALLMPAPLNTPEAISREAGQRFAAKRRGEEHHTVGIAQAAGTLVGGVDPGRVLTDEENAARLR